MSSAYTRTDTFSWTNAHYIGTKIAGDMRQMLHFYGKPTESEIEDYLVEITEHLAARYLSSFEVGFKASDNRRVVSLRYEVREGNTLADDNSGRVYPHADITGARYFSYLIRNSNFDNLSWNEQEAFENRMPVKRTGAAEPTDGNGYWTSDRGYASGNWGTERRTFRPL